MGKPHGIIIFGANGSGKTTIGRELARILGFKHIDHEDYAFHKSDIPYTNPRTEDECIELMLADIEKYGSFVLSAVTGDFGDEIVPLYDLAVYLNVPHDLRMERIKQREIDRFGDRVLEGGDMYEQQQKFHDFVASRSLERIEKWAETISCPVFRIDGAKNYKKTAIEIALQCCGKPQSWNDCEETIKRYIKGFVDLFKNKLCNHLVGVYLHGSLAMCSYFPPKSDMDILVVVDNALEADLAKEVNIVVARYSEKRPTVGNIECSVITLETARNAPSEMPYELHFSEMWYKKIIENQVVYGVRQLDSDLPAHLMNVKKRGVCLYGKSIDDVFGNVKWQDFMVAVLDDFEWLIEDENICESPYYCILNICRVLQALTESNQKCLSKYEGAIWGIQNLPDEYVPLIYKALKVYSLNMSINETERKTGGLDWNKSDLLAFRDYARSEKDKLMEDAK